MFMLRSLTTAGVVLSVGAGVLGPASAKTVADTWQISLQMPPQLWDDAAALPNIPGNELDVFSVGATKYRIMWANASVRQLP
jgi:hypothetical protein